MHGRLLVPALVVCLLYAAPLTAQTHTLSGKVYGGGSPLPNTMVEALTDGTTSVVAQSTTSGSGDYALSLPDGTYDLRVTPPAGSGFGQETVQNITIAGAARSYDIVLLSAGGGLQGTIRGYGGQPAQNVRLDAYTTNWQFIASTSSDADGRYELSIGSGTIILVAQAPWPPPATPVAPTSFWRYQYNLAISGSTTLDIDLPVVQISGVVTDSSGTPLSGATVQVDSNSWNGTTQVSLGGNMTVSTTATGAYEVLALAGSVNLTVRPPAGANAATLSETGLNVSGDLIRNVTLPAPTALSGTIRGHGGQPVQNVRLDAYTTNWQFIASTSSDSDGRYELSIGSGTIILVAQAPWPPPATPVTPTSFWRYQYNLAVNGSTTLDINLPVVQISGVVTDSSGTPLSGATVQVDSNSWNGTTQVSLGGNMTVSTTATGAYEVLALAGSVNLTVRPPAGANAATLSETGLNVTADLIRNITLPAPTVVSGTIRGYGGQPVQNARLDAYTTNWQFITSTSSDSDGRYELSIGSGTIILVVQAAWPPPATPVTPTSFWRYQYNVAISGSTTLDIDLPVVKISGVVTDSNGAPVPNVLLQADANSWNGVKQVSLGGNTSATTGTQGTYELLIFAGTANLTVRPPASSGFTVTALNGLSLAGDVTQRIILQRPDLSPPQIVAGPVVVHLSDDSVSISWKTNEAANSRVEYGIGSLTSVVSDNTMTTSHTVTLLNLAPLTIYSFRVASTDASGNGPVYSAVATFTTQGPPGDITPPVITDGPTVVFVDQTSALIQWTTDEPAAPGVSFGLTEALGGSVSGPAGRFRQSHSIRLTGLTPETLYYAQVSSVDPDGNAMTSSIFSFSTLAVPDTAAPVITAGPTVTSISDTKITVSWTTNEPATSGVSYNDGTQFFVVSDATLSREHEITLSGLQPQTLYYVTVSSTDAVGNGPTLGGPVEATTSATPDTTAPLISNLQVVDIGETSAVVTWTTDERATSAVNFGTASGVLDHVKAGVNAVTEHRMSLTGLLDGTTHYLTVSSTDASGNTATSDEISFRTVSAFVDMPPSPPGPITAPAGSTRAASVDLFWGASTDDLGVAGYEILRDGEVIASLDADTLSYSDAAPEGTFTYVIRATDTAGHTAVSEPVSVTVDRTAPQVAVPADILLDAVGTAATVTYEATASDDVDGVVAVACAPPTGSSLPVGATTIACSATDAAGNVGSAAFVVRVRDVTAPEIAEVVPDQPVLWPPNHQMVAVAIDVRASDLVDAAPVCRIVNVASSEPEDGLGDGDMPNDWNIDGALSVQLRAERSGKGPGRTYTITIECRDASGNRSSAATSVLVPHSRARK